MDSMGRSWGLHRSGVWDVYHGENCKIWIRPFAVQSQMHTLLLKSTPIVAVVLYYAFILLP